MIYIMKSLTLGLFIAFVFPLTVQATSLWSKSSNSQRGMFGGKRAYSVGDLITIDVAESSSLAASQNSVRNRQLEVQNAVTQFLYANSKLGTHNGGLPGTQIETQSSNQGGGSIANTQDLKGRVSVMVIDVLPNGVLVLEGARMVTFSGESYYAVLKGMVRQEDIGFGFKDGLRYRNIVSSQYIADAQIEFVSKGSLNDAQKESWYQKLSSAINPF
jgi:flagellar L-ring protein precursor FlgH